MIVLKHLAREFNLNPTAMRRILREKFGYHKRWQWTPEDPELAEVRKFLSSLPSKKQERLNVSSPTKENITDTRLRSTTRQSNSSRTLH
jgi:hypothetical protein